MRLAAAAAVENLQPVGWRGHSLHRRFACSSCAHCTYDSSYLSLIMHSVQRPTDMHSGCIQAMIVHMSPHLQIRYDNDIHTVNTYSTLD